MENLTAEEISMKTRLLSDAEFIPEIDREFYIQDILKVFALINESRQFKLTPQVL